MSGATDPRALDLLKKHWGFDAFRPGQEQVINTLLAGDSAAAVFPTGGGKSLCYQLPSLLFDGLTVVVSPLIALMKDQIDSLQKRGIDARRIDSSLSLDELREVTTAVRRGTLSLLYVAPERFNNERFRQMLEGARVSLFAVDEAHCISEWGHNFRPDYLKLVRFAKAYGAQRVLALTATATPAVLDDMCRQFDIGEQNAVRTPFYRDNLAILTQVVSEAERDAALLSRLADRPRGAGIVYVTRQQTAQDVATRLAAAGYDAVPYHAGLSPDKRAHVQDRFMASADGIVVATIAFGMGVDKADIRFVYHYNLPKSIESYSQEIGRAGRDGLPSICEVFACASDIHTLENFAHGDTPSRHAVHGMLESLFQLVEVGDRFDVSYYDLANTHDIRMLVVRTLLTYLELDGFVRAGTPFYSSYRFKPRMSSREILDSFEEPKRARIRAVLAKSEKKRTWFAMDVDGAARDSGLDRKAIVAVLDELHEGEYIELQSQGMRHAFVLTKVPASLDALADDLAGRMLARERRELDRLRGVFALMGGDTCQAARLSKHFGDPLETPCGSCTVCTGGPQPHAEPEKNRSEAVSDDVFAEVRSLRQQDDKYARALGEPRSVARFLCGLPSPATQRSKLTKHALFGSQAHRSFTSVLEAASDK